MMITAAGNGLRLLTLLWLSITFFWMSVEDTSVLTVVILGSGVAGLLGIWWVKRHYAGQRIFGRWVLILTTLSGAIIGSGSIVITTALMFFKTAWHAHLFPDYPIEMMLAMLTRLPVWGVAGALMGLAAGILRHETIQRDTHTGDF